MDLVYIVKESDNNPELRYSLRSIEKFVKFDKVWIVGYKPNWVKNVEYLPVQQSRNAKWMNSVNNIIQACKCEKISDDFVLMNDDFFALHEIKDLVKSCSLCLGLLSKTQKNHSRTSPWDKAFWSLERLLKKIGVNSKYYDFESHTPIIINKKKYLEVMDIQEVREFMHTSNVLHKRSLYRNYICVKESDIEILPEDCKMEYDSQFNKKSAVCDWLSVYDNQVDNVGFSRLNNALQELFPDKCKYEDDNYVAPVIKKVSESNIKERIIINADGSRKIVKQ